MIKIKFSIIIPVYNTSAFIEKCLNSVFSQTYDNYEVIVVNDGSTDDSESKIKLYSKIKYLKQENMGLSEARNNGVKLSSGDYILFLDSDDYFDKDLLLNLSKNINNEEDIVRFQARTVDENNNIKDYNEEPFENLNGVKAFEKIVKYHFVENAWLYVYKKEFWIKNKFAFAKGKFHEDFGLTPYVILMAQSVTSISYIGYNYFNRQNSIMNSNNYEKTKIKADDAINLGLSEIEILNELKINTSVAKSFIANSILLFLKKLVKKDQKGYIKIIKEKKIINYLLTNNFKRKIKYLLLKIKYNL